LTVFYLAVFGLSLGLSFVFTIYVRNVATRRGWVAKPTVERHLHTTPVPRLGGVAILLAFLVSLGIAEILSRLFPAVHSRLSMHKGFTILLSAVPIFLLGLYDDIFGAGPYLKFAVQALAAVGLFAGGLRILDVPVLFGNYQLPWFVGLPLTILWVLAITNAFNLIDGLDGLAAGSALFSTLVVFVVALLSQSSLVALLTIALAGAILGFLRFNFNPATIFLGDCGSLLIGFMLSALALEGAQKAPTIIAVAIPVVSFGLPILETTLSVLRRLIAGRPLFTADREHIHHKLLQRGLSHRQVVIVLYAVSAIFALLSLFLLWPTGSSLGLVLAVLGTGVWLGVQHLGYLEFGELRRVALRTIEQRQILINNLAIRRATEELKVTRQYDQLCRVLAAAFEANDFDAFDLNVQLSPEERAGVDLFRIRPLERDEVIYHWDKAGSPGLGKSVATWKLNLDLITTGDQYRGMLTIYRLYTHRDLQLDLNLLISIFPVALADALDRAFGQSTIVIPRSESAALVAVQAS
jgi:UDP-GlcNAc:undecaprenyl-phosphate GlcNAc-1-phosphate transferase